MILKIARAVQNLHREGKSLLLNRKGSVLVIVVVAMAALLILGVSLSTLALNDQHQAVRQQKNNEAYYLARSGAEAVAKVLLDNQANMAGYIGGTTGSELGNGRFEAVVEEGEDGTILIHSTGYSGDHSEKVTLTLIRGEEEESGGSGTAYMPDFDMAVFSNSNINLTGSSKINGNVGTNSTDPGTVELAWSTSVENLYIGEGGDPDTVVQAKNPPGNYSSIYNLAGDRTYQMPAFPEFPDDLNLKGNLSTKDAPMTISEDGYYDTIDIYRSLTVNVGDGVRKIRVKELKFNGWGSIPPDIGSSTIFIDGSGTLELYIENRLHTNNGVLQGSSSINHGGDAGQLMIYYAGDDDFTISGNAKIYGCFFSYSLLSAFNLGGSGGIHGAIFLKGPEANITGGTEAVVTVLYAPDTHVNFPGGSGEIRGAIVCDKFSAGGNSRVYYDAATVDEIWSKVPDFDFDFGSDPGGGPGSSSTPVFEIGYWTD